MSSLCVIGNSHVGSLKKAWDDMAERHVDSEVTFFASRGNHLNQLRASNGCLTTSQPALRQILEFTSGGSSEVDPNAYDVILIYGADVRPYFVTPWEKYSKGAIVRSVIDSVSNTLGYHLLRQLRSITEKKIFVGHCPLPAPRAVDSRPDPVLYIRGVELVNDLFYRELGAELVTQPIRTIVNGNATDPEFLRGATRLAVGDGLDDAPQPESDKTHMNKEFGALWWQYFFDHYCARDTPAT